MFVNFDEFGNVSAISERELDGYLKAPEGFDVATQNIKCVKDNTGRFAVLLTPEEVLQRERLKKVEELKTIGNAKIRTFNGKTYSQDQWVLKSQNFQDYKATYSIKLFTNTMPTQEESDRFKFACDMLSRKDRYVDRINLLEALILGLNADELALFDPADPNNWEHVEE